VRFTGGCVVAVVIGMWMRVFSGMFAFARSFAGSIVCGFAASRVGSSLADAYFGPRLLKNSMALSSTVLNHADC
jgi:hypothetical protein